MGTSAAVRAVTAEGGTVIASYPQIGVVVAHSDRAGFAYRVRGRSGVASAGATRTVPIGASPGTAAERGALAYEQPVGTAPKAGAARSAKGEEPLSAEQWNLRRIGADKAHGVTVGSPGVRVGVIDTGVDDTHEDLAANFDAANSVNCVGGKPDRKAGAWRPDPSTAGWYHGTHVAGIVAAAKNGKGVAGVAPGVRIAAVKVAEGQGGYFYPESVLCGFIWAAEHDFDITNNSYFVDPWYFNCPGQPDQKAISEALRRATGYAQLRGVLNIASAGNLHLDLADKTVDRASPTDSEPSARPVDNSCLDLPNELPGVLTVTATGPKDLKSSYSNYGTGVAELTAPGGDHLLQAPVPPATTGAVLSTFPGDQYQWLQGTSMAAPHVTGTAALLKSRHPGWGPLLLTGGLLAQADRLACPDRYDLDGNGEPDAVCQTRWGNGFYGAGMVDAAQAAGVRR
nr:S8 family serine peptidase [Streptomyces scabichelini]